MPRPKATPSLAGKRIVITRAEGQVTSLRKDLESLGAAVMEISVGEVEYAADDAAVKNVFDAMGEFDWIVFTSRNGVRGFFAQFFQTFNDIRAIGLARIACADAATAKEIAEFRLNVDLLPDAVTGDALASALVTEQNVEHLRVLVVTGNQEREKLVTFLAEKGKAIVDTLPVYAAFENDAAQSEAVENFRRDGADAIIFSDAAAVESFIAQARLFAPAKNARQPKAIALGATTANAMREAGIPVAAQVTNATPTALANAVTEALK